MELNAKIRHALSVRSVQTRSRITIDLSIYVCGISSDLSPLSMHSRAGSGVKADLCEGYDCSVQILAILFPFRPFTAIRSHLEPLGNHSCELKYTFISKQMYFHMQSGYYPF